MQWFYQQSLLGNLVTVKTFDLASVSPSSEKNPSVFALTKG